MSIRSALILFTLFTAGFSGLQAQVVHQVIPASAGKASGNGGTVSYTIGQVAYKTQTGTGGSVSQGIQQPYEIWDVTGSEAESRWMLTVTAFPNPVNDYLTLKHSIPENPPLSFSLYGVDGRAIRSGKVSDSETLIPMSDILSSVYFLKVTDNGKEVRIFKIVKN